MMKIVFLFYNKFIRPEPFKVNASFRTNHFKVYPTLTLAHAHALGFAFLQFKDKISCACICTLVSSLL